MSQALEIRDYTPSDGVICHGLRRSAFLGAFSESLAPDTAQIGADSYGVAEFAEQIGALETYVATIGGAVVGFCTIRVRWRYSAGHQFLINAFNSVMGHHI